MNQLLLLVASQMAIVSACASPTPESAEAYRAELTSREATVEELEEYCRTVECRASVMIQLLRDDGSQFKRFYALWPPVVAEGGVVNLLPGDTVQLMGDVEGHRIVAIRMSPSGLQPVRGLEFRFWQDTTMSAGSDMLLRVESTFERPVKFDVGMMTLDSASIVYTSSCPVHPGKIVFEHWPHAIFQLFVSNFRLLDESEADSCE